MFKQIIIVLLVILGSTIAYAERPDAPPYAAHGEYAVGTRELTLEDAERPLKITIWYPAANPDNLPEAVSYQEGLIVVEGHALQDAPPAADAPFPLIVFSHGSGGTRFQSVFYTEHLASQGFVVIAPDHPGNTITDGILSPDQFEKNLVDNFAYRPLDILRVIDYAETLTGTDGSLPGLIDMERVAVTGHSFGGYTTLSVSGGQVNITALENWCDTNPDDDTPCFMLDQAARIAALRGLDEIPEGAFPLTADPRIDAIVMLAPWDAPIIDPASIQKITIPSMILVGSNDQTTPAERDAVPIYDALGSSAKYLVIFENGGHFLFVDSCSELAKSFNLFDRCSDSVWDMERVHDLTNHLVTAFLRSILYADKEAAAALNLDAVDFAGVVYTTNTE